MAELISERATRQQAVGEALALKAVNSSQHAQLDELMRVASALEAPRRPLAASAGLATAPRTKTPPKGDTAARPKRA
ncbi:hypothetical protein [Burkholderia sp. MS455]|uniref:hypothetical protein n=1 Tax=Burkholderia sp. MS455 TaxID=2811788 RepID=UPI001EF5718F|nr:hypothetical protein [Burkholderia sp. MS455]